MKAFKLGKVNTVIRSDICLSGGFRGVPPARPSPHGPKFSQFHAVFHKIWQNHMLAAPWRVGAPSYRESWIRPCVCIYFKTFHIKNFCSASSKVLHIFVYAILSLSWETLHRLSRSCAAILISLLLLVREVVKAIIGEVDESGPSCRNARKWGVYSVSCIGVLPFIEGSLRDSTKWSSSC